MTRDVAHMTFWRLVSVRVSPDAESPELYCLLYEGKQDRPLTRNGRIIFFVDANRATTILLEYAPRIEVDEIDVDKPLFCLDLANTLYVMHANCDDCEGTVIDTLNLLLDFVVLCPLQPTAEQLQLLKDLADHFTFERNPKSFFAARPGARQDAMEAIVACIGRIVAIADVV